MALCGAAREVQGAPRAEVAPVFLGYVYGDIETLRYDLYTHLCHAFVVAGDDGRVIPTGGVPNEELTARARQAGVQLLVSLGGWGWDKQFATMAADAAALDRYVDEVLEIVADANYDGVDLDWEYPDTADEIVGFEKLVRQLRKGLDAIGEQRERPMLMTMAIAANPGTLRWLDTDFLTTNFDWVNLMSYDYAGEWSTRAVHNAPLFASSELPAGSASIERSVRFLLEERKLPPQRLVLGLPLYGRGFAVAKPYLPTAEAPRPKHGTVNFAQIARLQSAGWPRHWDDQTKTPWLLAPDGSEVIGYDDAQSLRLKTAWAMDRGLRGVFFGK